MSLLGPPAVRCHRIARWSRGVWAITAYEELVELGHLDAAGLQLLFELAWQEAHRFPSLAPPEGWTADALWDLAHDFFVDRGARVTTMLLAQASDEASIGRLLRRSLRNYLIDQVRKTDLGALRRRLEELLSDDPAVERVRAGEPGAGWWRLAGTSAAPWGGRFEDLVAAANGVPGIRLVRWSSSTRRNPIAERQSLLDIVHAVLAAADGCLDLRQLVAVFTRRFPTAVEWGMRRCRRRSRRQRAHRPRISLRSRCSSMNRVARCMTSSRHVSERWFRTWPRAWRSTWRSWSADGARPTCTRLA